MSRWGVPKAIAFVGFQECGTEKCAHVHIFLCEGSKVP
jgi:hypothetical protein